MVPRPKNECPNGTFNNEDKKNACCCEGIQNCCWNECRIDTPPETCLQGLNAFWMKDPRKNSWVAQERIESVDIMISNVSLTNMSYPTGDSDMNITTSKCILI